MIREVQLLMRQTIVLLTMHQLNITLMAILPRVHGNINKKVKYNKQNFRISWVESLRV